MTDAYKPITDFEDFDFDHSSMPIRDFPPGKSRYSLAIFPDELNFGTIEDGQTSAPQTIILINNGFDDLIINSIRSVGDFALIGTMPTFIQVGQNTSIQVSYVPTAVGNGTGGIYIDTGNAAGEEFIKLIGSSNTANIDLSIIRATNLNDGSPNNIIATTLTPIPSGNGKALISLNITTANISTPVTVKFNNDPLLTIKDSDGSDVDIAELQIDMIVIGYKLDNTFRLLLSNVSAALLGMIQTDSSIVHIERVAAETAATSSASSATAAVASALLAQKYAINPEDIPITGTEFSAKHWATKSAESLTTLLASLVNYIQFDTDHSIVNTLDAESLTLLSIFGVSAFKAISNRNTAVFGSTYDPMIGGFPCGVVGVGFLNNTGGYVCGSYGHVIATAGGVATNEVCVENRAGPANATLPPNRAVGSTDNLSIIQTIATLGGVSNNNVSIGTHYAWNGFSMLCGQYMAADACKNYGIFIDATSIVSAAIGLKVRGAGGQTSVADFQYMNVNSDLVPNTRWLNSSGSPLIVFTAAGSIQVSGVASQMNRLRIGTGAAAIYQHHIVGAGQATAAIANLGAKDGAILIQDTGVVGGAGGALLLGASAVDGAYFAAIKGLMTNGTGNTTGDLAFAVRKVATDAALTKAWSILATDLSLAPGADNVTSLGTASFRTSVLYSGTGTISTSDERSKENIININDTILDAWADINWKQFKFIEGTRTHTGLIAQDIERVFKAHNLNAFEYGVLCYDEWPAISAEIDEEGNIISPAIEAGNRYGVRYDEAQSIESAYQRRRMDRIEAKLEALSK